MVFGIENIFKSKATKIAEAKEAVRKAEANVKDIDASLTYLGSPEGILGPALKEEAKARERLARLQGDRGPRQRRRQREQFERVMARSVR